MTLAALIAEYMIDVNHMVQCTDFKSPFSLAPSSLHNDTVATTGLVVVTHALMNREECRSEE